MLTFLHIESAPSLTLFGSTLLVRNDSSTSFKASPHKMSSFANFLLALLAEMGSSKDVPTLPDVTVNFDNFGVSILLTLNLTFSHCRSEILLGANSESLLSCGFSNTCTCACFVICCHNVTCVFMTIDGALVEDE